VNQHWNGRKLIEAACADLCTRPRLNERPEVVVDNDLSPLADTEVHYLWSARTETEFKIFVGHCGTLPRESAASTRG